MQEIFPEWVLYENRIKQLASYIQVINYIYICLLWRKDANENFYQVC